MKVTKKKKNVTIISSYQSHNILGTLSMSNVRLSIVAPFMYVIEQGYSPVRHSSV